MDSAPGRRSFRAPFLAFTGFLVVGMGLVSGVGAAEVPPPLLPDLRTLRPTSVGMDTNDVPGTRLLRFSNEILNRGVGPVELGPKAEDCNGNGDAEDDRSAYQHVFKDTETDESPGVFLRFTKNGDPADLFDEQFAGCSVFHPGHNHWHFEEFAKYELLPMTTAGPDPEIVSGSSDKVSFCLVDTHPLRPDLPGFGPRYYGQGSVHCAKDEVTGISVGWSDLYSSSLADQWIDIGPKGGGVPDGTYCLKSTADPSNHILEVNDANNSRSVRIKIKGTAVKIAGRRTCRVVAPPT